MTKTPSKIIILTVKDDQAREKAPNELRLEADINTRNTGML